MIHVDLHWDIDGALGCAASSPEEDQYFHGRATFAPGEGLSKILTNLCRYERHGSISDLKIALIASAHNYVGAILDANCAVQWMAGEPLEEAAAVELEKRNAPAPPPPPAKARLPMVRSKLADGRLRCEGCEHWDREHKDQSGGNAPSPVHALCAAAVYGDDNNESEGLVVNDFERYAAVLWTLPDFGCVLFEEKAR